MLYALILVMLGVCGLLLRLSQGPIDLERIAAPVLEAIARVPGPGFRASASSLVLEWVDGSVHLMANDLNISRENGDSVAYAPRTGIGIDPLALLRARIAARSLDLRNPALALTVSGSGKVSLGGVDPNTVSGPQVPAYALLNPDLLKGLAPEGDGGGSMDIPAITFNQVSVSVREETTGNVTRFRSFDLFVAHMAGNVVQARLKSDGRAGPWSMMARLGLSPDASGGRSLSLAVRNLDIGDLAETPGTEPTSTVNVELDGAVGRDSRLQLRGAASLTAGRMPVADEVLDIPELRLDVALDSLTRSLEIIPSRIETPSLAGTLSGRIVASDPADPTHPVRISLLLDNLELDTARTRNPTARQIVFSGVFEQPSKVLWLDRFAVLGQGAALEARGSVRFVGETPAVAVSGYSEGQDAAAIRALWPAPVSPHLRRWVLDNVVEGRVENAEFEAMLPPGVMLEGRPLSREMFKLNLRLSNGTVRAAPGLPPVTGLAVTVNATGVSAQVDGKNGQIAIAGQSVMMPTISFVMEDINVRPVGVADALLLGSAPALLALAEAKGVSLSKGTGFELKSLVGEGLARVQVRVPLSRRAKASEQKVDVDGEFRNVTGKGLIEGRDLEKGAFRFRSEGEGFSADGNGLVGGTLFRLAARQEGGKFVVRAETDADDVQRTKMGMDFGDLLSGTTPVRFIREVSGADVVRRVEVDMTQARFSLPMVAFEKPKGQSGLLSFQPKASGKAMMLEELVLQGKGWSAKGKVRIGENGQVQSVDMSEAKLRPEDNVSAKMERDGDRFIVRVSGKSLDARPFIARLMAPETKKQEASKERLDLQVRVERVLGANDVTMTDVRLEMQRTGPRTTVLTLGAAFGGAARITGEVLEDKGRPYLFISSTDGGSTLRFVDLYRRMVGGRLTLTQTMTDSASSDGVLFVENFRVVNDPAMQRLFGEATHIQDSQRTAPIRGEKVNPSDVSFDRLRVAFTKNQSVMQVREGVLRNNASGITFEGRVDWRRDMLDLKGTFIPAYVLNNFLARVPVVGALLGGQNEGLLGVTYAVTGPVSAPVLRVNPISAIAPGFLRGLFQFPDPPGTAPRPPERAPSDTR